MPSGVGEPASKWGDIPPLPRPPFPMSCILSAFVRAFWVTIPSLSRGSPTPQGVGLVWGPPLVGRRGGPSPRGDPQTCREPPQDLPGQSHSLSPSLLPPSYTGGYLVTLPIPCALNSSYTGLHFGKNIPFDVQGRGKKRSADEFFALSDATSYFFFCIFRR